jgi:hypothetical protein
MHDFTMLIDYLVIYRRHSKLVDGRLLLVYCDVVSNLLVTFQKIFQWFKENRCLVGVEVVLIQLAVLRRQNGSATSWVLHSVRKWAVVSGTLHVLQRPVGWQLRRCRMYFTMCTVVVKLLGSTDQLYGFMSLYCMYIRAEPAETK